MGTQDLHPPMTPFLGHVVCCKHTHGDLISLRDTKWLPHSGLDVVTPETQVPSIPTASKVTHTLSPPRRGNKQTPCHTVTPRRGTGAHTRAHTPLFFPNPPPPAKMRPAAPPQGSCWLREVLHGDQHRWSPPSEQSHSRPVREAELSEAGGVYSILG